MMSKIALFSRLLCCAAAKIKQGQRRRASAKKNCKTWKLQPVIWVALKRTREIATFLLPSCGKTGENSESNLDVCCKKYEDPFRFFFKGKIHEKSFDASSQKRGKTQAWTQLCLVVVQGSIKFEDMFCNQRKWNCTVLLCYESRCSIVKAYHGNWYRKKQFSKGNSKSFHMKKRLNNYGEIITVSSFAWAGNCSSREMWKLRLGWKTTTFLYISSSDNLLFAT